MLKKIRYMDTDKSVDIKRFIISVVELTFNSKDSRIVLKGDKIIAFIIRISIRKANVRFQNDACVSTTLFLGKFNFIQLINN